MISADALAVVRHVTALFFGVLYVVLGVSMIVGAAEMLPPGFWIIGMLLGPAFYLIVLVLVPLYFVVLAVNDGAVKPTFAATIPLFGVGIPLLYFCVLDFLGRR